MRYGNSEEGVGKICVLQLEYNLQISFFSQVCKRNSAGCLC